jgi:hypothetical protein
MATANGKAAPAIIDFSNVKDRGEYNPKHIEAGDYRARISKVIQQEAKDGEDMWVFTIQLPDVPRASYPYYCKLVDNQFWKIKALFSAAGIEVGKRKVKADPNKLVGKEIAVGMDDDEYEGRLKSIITDVFALSELHDSSGDEDDEVVEEEAGEDDYEEEEEAPAPKQRAAKKAPPVKKTPAKKPPVEEDDEEEDDDELDIDEL